MSEHAEAGKALSIEQGGYQPLQIGDDDDSPHITRISNNNANNDARTTIESSSLGMGKRKSKDAIMFSNPQETEEHSQEYLRAKATVEYFFESIPFVALMSIMTIWALYNDDIRQAFTDKEADEGFEIVITIAFFLFLLELLASCFYKQGYLNLPLWEPLPGETTMQTWTRRAKFGSFFFWLDIIATFSLILEMKWMLGSNAFNKISGGGNVRSAKATAASQSATRAGRVVRLVRMVRLVRLVKLYKYSSMLTGTPAEEKNEEEVLKESRVGSAMTDLTNRRVIILILVMLIIIPLLTFSDDDISQSLATQFIGQLAQLAASDPSYTTGLNLAIQQTKNELPLLFISFDDKEFFRDNTIDARRPTELNAYEVTYSDFTTITYFDDVTNAKAQALFSIYTTSFIIVLLMLGTYFFSSDVNKLVIGPIERLVDLVQKISANPLGVEYKAMGADEGFVAGMETTMLLTTIMKIGGLMRVGFGEAGASVIAKNLSESSGGSLNLLGGGTLITSIFGFCDVRQFTDTTECLQEEVMLFVNRIAHILHNIVVQCSGSANKNIGDAFLLTWKLDANLTPEQTADLADQALLAFVKALIELARYQNYICNFSVAATARLYKRFPEYNVRIGSGLHMGWAIEGAIGSNRKIDASYLSPHVNTTEFLESSTKAYGVALLISEPFFRLLSAEASKYCRQVDRLRRANDEVMSIYTYDADLTIDWNDPYRHTKKKLLNMTAGANASAVNANANAATQAAAAGRKRMASVFAQNLLNPINENGPAAPAITASNTDSNAAHVSPRAKTNVSKRSPSLSVTAEKDAETGNASRDTAKESPTIVVAKYNRSVWTKDQDVVDLRHLVSDSFRTKWEVGIAAYVKGDWAKAKEVFQETLALGRNKDGPSKFLLSVIDEHHGEAPGDWPGYRDEGGGH